MSARDATFQQAQAGRHAQRLSRAAPANLASQGWAKKKMASDEGVKSSNNSPVAPSPDDSRGQGQWEDACWQPSIPFGLALVASAVVLFFSVARPESQVCTPRAGACSFA